MIYKISTLQTCLFASSWYHCFLIPRISYNLEVSSKGLISFRFNILWQECLIGGIKATLKWDLCPSYYITAVSVSLMLTSNGGSRGCLLDSSIVNFPPSLFI